MQAALARPKTQLWLRTSIAVLVLISTFVWLWQFRLAALFRHEAAGRIVGRAPLFATQDAPAWLVPLYTVANYFNTTWETTLAAILIAGTLQTFLHAPLLRLLRTQTGWRAYVAGIAFGIPNVLCTCCAAPLFASLYKKGTPFATALATFITAPSLNIMVLVLSVAFLPWQYAAARIVLGLVAALAVPVIAARMTNAPPPPVNVDEKEEENTPWTSLGWKWIENAWGIAVLAVPLLILGYFLVGIVQVVLPLQTLAPMLRNGPLEIVATAFIGTVIMIPTFTEISFVSTLVPLGMGSGPAAALLISAPAVSLPSLIVIGRATRSWRIPIVVGMLVFLLGVTAGLVFMIIG